MLKTLIASMVCAGCRRCDSLRANVLKQLESPADDLSGLHEGVPAW